MRDDANPRRSALEIITQALKPASQEFAQELLDRQIRRHPMKPQDRRLLTDLVYGVIRRLGTLDAVLQAYSKQPLKQLDKVVVQSLRLGLYQIMFLERIPLRAAVDESVEMTRATGNTRATGFVNGVLRSIGREITFSEEPDPRTPRASFLVSGKRAATFARPVLPAPSENAAYVAAMHSMPKLLVSRWLALHGNAKTRELCELANTPPPLFVRPNSLKTSPDALIARFHEEGIEAALSRSGRTLRLPPGTQVAQLASFTDGLFIVQDDSSAAVAPFLGPNPDERIADLAAAPGGKCSHIAELMRNRGVIAAVDSSGRRLERLVENMQRLGIAIIAPVEADGVEFAAQHRCKFDRVLLDAPCSNTGVLRRRVEARWRFSEKTLSELAAQQRALLAAALQMLKPGGVIVYSTCSLEPEENDQTISAVLRGAPAFQLDAQEQMLPTRDAGDGIFMARIVRRR